MDRDHVREGRKHPKRKAFLMSRFLGIPRSAEQVSDGHPDKYCDQLADTILDEIYHLCDTLLGSDAAAGRASVRLALDGVAKGHHLSLGGEWRLPEEVAQHIDIPAVARRVWKEVGYPVEDLDRLSFDLRLHRQSPEIAHGVDRSGGQLGAGDQGIVVGFATDETEEMLPRELVLARLLLTRLRDLRVSGQIPWLRSDAKSQVTLDAEGTIQRVVLALQHSPEVAIDELRDWGRRSFLPEVLGVTLPDDRVTINGAGSWTIGGPIADAGTIGRKIVVDAYGPQISVGGGAYSGKDPTKVDRSMAYMARHIAKTIVVHRIGDARECSVKIAFAIGQEQPEMVTAITEDGTDVSEWVRAHFPSLTPASVIERFALTSPSEWSYRSAAALGHYGREEFPWEAVAEVPPTQRATVAEEAEEDGDIGYLIVNEGIEVAYQEWDSGGPGAGAGRVSVYRFRDRYYGSHDAGIDGPFMAKSAALKAAGVDIVTDATVAIWHQGRGFTWVKE